MVKYEEAISLKHKDTLIELFDAYKRFRAEEAQVNAEKDEVARQATVNAPHLPKIELPYFDGKIENWIDFKTILKP